MPGEQLMCVWQAVLSKDVFPESGVKRATVMSVVENFAHIRNVVYTERRFQEVFTESKVKFEDLKKYVQDTLRSPAATLLSILPDIEQECWEMCQTTYESEALNTSELKKMWSIFNRVCLPDSYPPVVTKDDADWLFSKIARSLDKTWTSRDSLPNEGLRFQEMINTLDKMYFSVTATPKLREGIDEIHNLLVVEILKIGYLTKRTRKQANWTNWLKRWFVMVPGRLMYYEHSDMKTKKGEIVLERSSQVEGLPDYKGILSKLSHRFKVSTNYGALEIEMCAESPSEKSAWMNQINVNLKAVMSGVTPMSQLLRERGAKSHQEAQKQLEEKQTIARHASTKPRQASTEKPEAAAAAEVRLRDDDGYYDNKTAEVQRDKVRAVFCSIDKDGNGRIDRDEFFSFLTSLGAKMERREADVLFHGIDKDSNGTICFEEFYESFIRMVMGVSNTDEEAKLRTAFLKADRDGSGAVSFREFAEFAWAARRSIAMDDLARSFDKLDVDKTGEIDFSEFRRFFDEQGLVPDMQIDEGIKQKEAALEELLKENYNQADASTLANYLRGRWKAFASFKRTNKEGKLVMTGAPGMVADVVPGSYNLLDLALFNDLPPIIPKHVSIKGVLWNSSHVQGKSGRVVFPADFNGKIPVDVATNDHLAYYGATLATSNQMQVSLLYRHGIQDFTYENNYLDEYVTKEGALGGSGIEKHDFAHLDCPLEEESGTFIIAKFTDDGDLHLTGFKIPTRHTLYLPGGVIHSNDYLKGTWRTMLSDEAEIDHVQLVRQNRKDKVEVFEKFTFDFEQ